MKTAVVFYSYTGNTRTIVEKIRNKIDCDIFEIEPKIPFLLEDYDAIVSEYQSNKSVKKQVEIKDIDIDLSIYDNIIIGTPVWWYTITPVIRRFLNKYDLSGKNVYAFATNAGWLGITFKEIESLCKGNVKGTLDIRFNEDWRAHRCITSDEELNNWLDKIY